MTAAEAKAAFARGKVTASALVEDSLARIAALDPKLNAFVLVDAEGARKAAKAIDRARKSGKKLGPLAGIPFALKDLYATAGLRTTAHSKLLIDNVPKHDSMVTAKLKAAGAILVGKLATHEFATGGPAYDLPFPPARNPWNTEHFTAGSSSGSGAAAAAGLVPLTMGSDTSGSIRGPAAFCGIAGFKPTYGVVSRSGVIPLANSLDHCGPMCWTVEDCALMMDAIAGHDPADPGSADRKWTPVSRNLGAGIKGMKIAVARHFHEKEIECDPAIARSLDDALKVLTKLGAKLTDVSLPAHADWDACVRVILYAEAYAIHEHDLKTRPQDYAAITRARLMTGSLVSAADYLQALRWRRRLNTIYAKTLAGFDALVTGCALTTAPKLDEMAKPPYFSVRGKFVMAPFSVAGAPSLSVCTGFSADGLPHSMQIAGLPFQDATVLRVGHAYERATPWRDRRPPTPS